MNYFRRKQLGLFLAMKRAIKPTAIAEIVPIGYSGIVRLGVTVKVLVNSFSFSSLTITM
jgi:hypothetical protein